MGKKRNNNKNLDVLAVPSTKSGGGKYARDSDASDLESTAYSSIAGDLDQHSIEDEEMNDMILVDSFGEQVENAQDKKIGIRMKAISNICVLLKRTGSQI
uniref:Uncharacterized protein n=1 Tax=Ditylenchus dipsaci TaxID=166011 RepID=A0A915D083_9BILA